MRVSDVLLSSLYWLLITYFVLPFTTYDSVLSTSLDSFIIVPRATCVVFLKMESIALNAHHLFIFMRCALLVLLRCTGYALVVVYAYVLDFGVVVTHYILSGSTMTFCGVEASPKFQAEEAQHVAYRLHVAARNAGTPLTQVASNHTLRAAVRSVATRSSRGRDAVFDLHRAVRDVPRADVSPRQRQRRTLR